KKQEARSKKQEARSKKQEARSKKQEARSKKQEARSKKQEALHLLQEAYDHHESTFLMIRESLDLLTLKDQPEYQVLLQKLNVPRP
ncbi:MAG: hypothetical protein WBV50_14880, partial [Candidatus Acidiferrum sp.]